MKLRLVFKKMKKIIIIINYQFRGNRSNPTENLSEDTVLMVSSEEKIYYQQTFEMMHNHTSTKQMLMNPVRTSLHKNQNGKNKNI